MSAYAWHLAEPRHPEKSNRTQAPVGSASGSAAPSSSAPPPPSANAPTPSTTDRRFSPNQRVYVFVHSDRDTGAGTIEATPEQLEGPDRERFAGRYRVRFDEAYDDGRGHKRAHVRPARLQAVLRPPLPLPLTQPQAVVTPCTDEFRRQARAQLSCGRDRRVLEVGCSTGECSAVIAQHVEGYASESEEDSGEQEEETDQEEAGKDGEHQRKQQLNRQRRRRVWSRGLVAVDLAADALQQARGRVPPPGAKFLLADVLAEPAALAERLLGKKRAASSSSSSSSCPPPVGAIFLDIGGKRAIADVVAAVDALTRVFRPELVVVKSEELAASAREWKAGRRAEEAQEQEEEAQEEEWRGEGSPSDAVPEPGAWWREAQRQRRPQPPENRQGAGTVTAPVESPEAVVEVPPWYPRLVVRKRRAGLDKGGGGAAAAPAPSSASSSSDLGCWLGVRPQRLPQRLVPGSSTAHICRFSNYGRCLRHEAWLRRQGAAEGGDQGGGEDDAQQGDCPYDHTVCHACLAPGHRAVDEACPVASAAYAAAAAREVS